MRPEAETGRRLHGRGRGYYGGRGSTAGRKLTKFLQHIAAVIGSWIDAGFGGFQHVGDNIGCTQ